MHQITGRQSPRPPEMKAFQNGLNDHQDRSDVGRRPRLNAGGWRDGPPADNTWLGGYCNANGVFKAKWFGDHALRELEDVFSL